MLFNFNDLTLKLTIQQVPLTPEPTLAKINDAGQMQFGALQ